MSKIVLKTQDIHWPGFVQEILDLGAYSESELAEIIGIEQSSVNRLKNGGRPRGPTWVTGARLVELHGRLMQQRAA